jgi:hypothetical protein
MNRSAIDYDWPSTSLPTPSNPAQLPADPRLSIVNETEPAELESLAGQPLRDCSMLLTLKAGSPYPNSDA